MAEIINGKELYNIVRKTLSMMNEEVIRHGEISGYILYKMMQMDNQYNKQDLVDYTMVGILHDLGIYKIQDFDDIATFKPVNAWSHSIYGYLFMRDLSPFSKYADIVLYHHLYYNKSRYINSENSTVIEYLNFADKMDAFLFDKDSPIRATYFQDYRDRSFSSNAQTVFLKAEKKFNITANILNGSYQEELDTLLSKKLFSETYKRQLLEMLIYLIDFRSEVTVVHTLSTVCFATEIGRLMRLSAYDMQILHYGALLHDVGKLSIPLEVLEAPRRLTDEEMAIMRTHVEVTEEILRGVVGEEILEIAIRHHEKLDGTGYHRGLKGEQLTLPQRIVAVADIISALYDKRSYKEGFEADKIKAILQSDADAGKIDPDVVACAIRNFTSIEANCKKARRNTIGTYRKMQMEYDLQIQRFQELENITVLEHS